MYWKYDQDNPFDLLTIVYVSFKRLRWGREKTLFHLKKNIRISKFSEKNGKYLTLFAGIFVIIAHAVKWKKNAFYREIKMSSKNLEFVIATQNCLS